MDNKLAEKDESSSTAPSEKYEIKRTGEESHKLLSETSILEVCK